MVLLAIFDQVYNFSFMLSYENLLSVPGSTIEFDFQSWWRLKPADLQVRGEYRLIATQLTFDCLLPIPIWSTTIEAQISSILQPYCPPRRVTRNNMIASHLQRHLQLRYLDKYQKKKRRKMATSSLLSSIALSNNCFSISRLAREELYEKHRGERIGSTLRITASDAAACAQFAESMRTNKVN